MQMESEIYWDILYLKINGWMPIEITLNILMNDVHVRET